MIATCEKCGKVLKDTEGYICDRCLANIDTDDF